MHRKNLVFIDFSTKLYESLCKLNSGVKKLELYEFRYALENIKPENFDWNHIEIPSKAEITIKISNRNFYKNIELKPKENSKITLDKSIVLLTESIFAGIVKEIYDLNWVNEHFYFDVRGFLFLPRTLYFTDSIMKHLRYKPYLSFKKRQKDFDNFQSVGFKEFKEANKEIDSSLIDIIENLTWKKGFPVIIAIAGPTAAGKTEFSEYLMQFFTSADKTISSVEMDNFFIDRDYREKINVGSMSRESIHFDLFLNSLIDLKKGKSTEIPKYDFTKAVSSHDSTGKLKDGASTLLVRPADVIYIEGNFPFLFDEIIPLIDIKIFYLTDDPVRLKRKWKRDIDYRKKYDPNYLCNRYFRTQFLKAEACYLTQLEICDIAVDTTQANIFVSHKIAETLEEKPN